MNILLISASPRKSKSQTLALAQHVVKRADERRRAILLAGVVREIRRFRHVNDALHGYPRPLNTKENPPIFNPPRIRIGRTTPIATTHTRNAVCEPVLVLVFTFAPGAA